LLAANASVEDASAMKASTATRWRPQPCALSSNERNGSARQSRRFAASGPPSPSSSSPPPPAPAPAPAAATASSFSAAARTASAFVRPTSEAAPAGAGFCSTSRASGCSDRGSGDAPAPPVRAAADAGRDGDAAAPETGGSVGIERLRARLSPRHLVPAARREKINNAQEPDLQIPVVLRVGWLCN